MGASVLVVVKGINTKGAVVGRGWCKVVNVGGTVVVVAAASIVLLVTVPCKCGSRTFSLRRKTGAILGAAAARPLLLVVLLGTGSCAE